MPVSLFFKKEILSNFGVFKAIFEPSLDAIGAFDRRVCVTENPLECSGRTVGLDPKLFDSKL